MKWSDWLSIIGAVTGGIGAASGYYSFILSSYRVEVQINLALRTESGGYISFSPDWTDGFDHGQNYIRGSESLLVQARNSGRSKIDIGQVVIKNYQKKATDAANSMYLVSSPPFNATKMPFPLDYGSSCDWLIPLNTIRLLSNHPPGGQLTPRSIFVELRLADGKTVESKKGLTPQQLDSFYTAWEAYQRGEHGEGRSNV